MLSDLCVRRPVFATMLVMSLVVLGTFSFRGLGVDLFPKADPATVSVVLSLPGASPDEMSSSVIEPMEQAISGVSGIDEIQARIAEGRGQITVRFVLERDLNDAANDVREKVASAIRNMPPELLPPVITKVDPDADPVMSLIVSSDAMSLRTLTELTDKQIARAIQTVNGVGEVSLAGGRAREIHIVVDIEKLNSYGLSMTELRDAVVAENVEIPGGTVEQGKGQLLLRTLGRVDAAQDFNDIVVATREGTPIRVSDIGYAEDSFQRPTSAVWLGKTPAVMLDIRRAMGENTVAVIEGVRPSWRRSSARCRAAVKVTVIRDDSRFIYASIASLEEHLIFGALFATIVVMIFIRNIRAVLISALAIPASIISSFTLMNIMGFTLNNMTLLGITLAVGIVIDDAIVVLENIFRYIEEKNCSPFEAAIQGTREVALAVMATTLSLVVIFLPIAFMNGYAKRFINPFGWTIAFAILVSMLVSFTLTPMLSSRFLKLSDAAADRKTKERGFFHWLDGWYTRRVNWALDHSGIIIGISVVTALLTFPVEPHGRPRIRAQRGHGRMDHPRGRAGRHLARGDQRDRLQAARRLEGHRRRGAISSRRSAFRRTSSSPTHIHFLCQALPIEERKNTQAQIITEMRRRLAAHESYRPSISSRTALGSGEGTGGFAIAAYILGPDLDQIVEYSKKALEAAQNVPSLTEVKIGLNVSNPEIHVAVDRKRAADLGVRMATIGNTLRLAVSGDDQISFFKEGQEQYPVKIRVLESQRGDIAEIGRLTVPSANGPVRIDNIAQLERGLGPTTLQRSNRQFAVNLIADVAPGHALDEASNDVRKMLAGLEHAADHVVQAAGAVEDPGRNDREHDHGHRPGDDLRLHGAGVAVRELPAADRHHAGAADCRALRAVHAVGHRPDAEPVERARHAPAARHRQEELDSAGGLRQRPPRPRCAAPRGHRRGVPHAASTDSDDDDGHHRRADTDVARHRDWRYRACGDCRDHHRWPVVVPVPDPPAGSRGLCEVRCDRAGGRGDYGEGLAREGLSRDRRPASPGYRVPSGLIAAPRLVCVTTGVVRNYVWLPPLAEAQLNAGTHSERPRINPIVVWRA